MLEKTEYFLIILVFILSILVLIFSEKIARKIWSFYIWKGTQLVKSGLWRKDAQKYRTDKNMSKREESTEFRITKVILRTLAVLCLALAAYILFFSS